MFERHRDIPLFLSFCTKVRTERELYYVLNQLDMLGHVHSVTLYHFFSGASKAEGGFQSDYVKCWSHYHQQT